jgi:hypothetical protein
MDDDFDFMKPSKVYFLDTNLSSPVLTTELDATRHMLLRFIEMAESHTEYIRARFEERTEYSYFKKLCRINSWKKQTLEETTQLDPTMYPRVEELMLQAPLTFSSFYDEAQEIAAEIEKAVADGLEARGLPREAIEGTARLLGSGEARRYRDAYEQFSNLFGRAESRVKTAEYVWTKGVIGLVEIWIHPRYSLIKFDSKIYYSSLNQILMLKDKLATRYMLYEHVLPLRLRPDLTNHLTRLFKWQDEVLTAYGNKAYGILKAVEPMFKTRLSHINDNIFGSDTAYTRMIDKLKKKEREVELYFGRSIDAIHKLQKIVENVTTTDELVELFGCQKSCGHPIIDPVRGGLSAAHEARTPDKTSLVDAQRLRNTFCHIFLTTYISKHGNWPKLVYLKQGTTLEILNTRQERGISYSSYPLEDWTHVEWSKLFDMDYFPNFLELMDDKSISYYKRDKHLAWDSTARPSSQRRLLLEVLQREKIDLEPLVQRISSRDVPEDWKIVTLYPKEREFKEDPRMFAMLVLEMRCFFTCIEANIAEYVFRYLPQQTMTKTKTQIQERFLSFTDPRRNPTDWTLFLEIDLSRWNLRWRQMVIHMIGHDLNRMFGVKGTFTITHWFFSQAQIVVRVGGLRPEGIELDEPPESGLAWRNHLGGFEGLNQKLWTAATYAMVEMALAPMVTAGTISSYELIGQGDNQVVRVGIPIRPEAREDVIPPIRDEINQRLEKTCADVNQEVKPEENVESTSVLTYSKDVYVGGVEYPTSLKKHSRLFPVTSMDFPSTAMNASAIMAGAVAGAENSRHSLCSAVIGWYHTARYLRAASEGYSIHGKSSPKMSKEEIIAALILPPSIGGYIGTPIASFIYKGGSDPLGKEISSLRLLADSRERPGVIASRALRGLEEKYSIDSNPSLDTLIENPYGLPIARKASPLSQVSNLTLEAFRGKVQNKDISPLLETSVTTAENILKQDILSIRPLNPLLAHDLYDSSGFGTVKIIRKMFLATRTVQAIAQWVNPNITHNFLRADKNDMLWFKQWIAGLPNRGYSGRNSYELSRLFRTYWGLDLHGVSNYQPLDSYHRANSTRGDSSVKWSCHSATDLLTTRGPLSGYVGTATREKRSEHGYKIVDAGAPSRAMMKLQLIRSQAYGNDNFNLLLDRIGRTRTNVNLSDITDLLDKVIGGSISHKYSTAIRNMAASYVGPLNFVTHIRLDTDNLGKVSGGLLNYPVMTQEFMVVASAEAKMLNIHRGCHSGELLLETQRMEPLPDDSLSAGPPEFTSALLPKSKLLYTPNLMLARTYESVVSRIPRGIVAVPTSYTEREVIELAAVGFFMELLRDSSKAKVLADTRGVSALPGKLQIDIAEAHNLGPMSLVKAMSHAIMNSSLRDTFRTLHLHPERWDESLFMAHSIKTCIRACSSYWKHPLFYSHPEYKNFTHSKLRYAGGMSLESRVDGWVRKTLVKSIGDLTSRFWKSPVPVFAGEGSMSPLEALTVAGAKIIYQLYVIQAPHAREFGNLYASYTRLPTRTSLTPDDLLELLRARYQKLAAVYRKQGDIMTANQIADLGHMRGVVVFNDDVRTVLRYARSLPVCKALISTKHLIPTNMPVYRKLDICSSCQPKPVGVDEAIWRRFSVRPNGGLASAGYTWAPLLSIMTIQRQVLIVGSGNGGLADLLITAFNCQVVGVDLESDLPQEVATLMNYVPVGVQPQNAQNYTQSDLCLTTTGDWLEEDVRSEFLSSLTEKSTVIVDAIFDVNSVYELTLQVMQCEAVERLYIRTIGPHDDTYSYTTWLRARYGTRQWAVSTTYASLEHIFEISRDKTEFLHSCIDETHDMWFYVGEECHMLIPERTQELVSSATRSTVAWEGEDLAKVHSLLHGLCSSLLNKPKRRQLLYKDRINLIYAFTTIEAALSENPVALIQSWISDEVCETSLFSITMRSDLKTHLLRYVPRIRVHFTRISR